ncbi:MAG: glycosyltransferase [Planctomycetes bacterium]|nr:glycosyltransferase [Planctomycetota bacterium]
MRIALLSHTAHTVAGAVDGIDPAVLLHARALIELGHSVEVFAAVVDGGGDGVRPRELVRGVPCTRYRRNGALREALVGDGHFGLARVAESLVETSYALACVRRALRREEFDVVEIVGDGAAAGLVALCDGLPALVRSNGVWAAAGSTAERLGASRLARIGMAAARSVSVPSFWLRDELAHRGVYSGALVVPDGIELPPDAVHAAADGKRLFVWWDGDSGSVEPMVAVIAKLLGDHEGLSVTLSGPKAGDRILTGLRSRAGGRDDLGARVSSVDASAGLPAVPSIGLFWFGSAPVCPAMLLAAMAAGMPLAVHGAGAVAEAARDELDALLCKDEDSVLPRLNRLLSTPGLRARLSKAARHRAASRFDPLACAERRLQAYGLAVTGRANRAGHVAGDDGAVVLGPANWFDAWWLAGTERQPTGFDRDEAGRIRLLDLDYDELKVVEAVLTRAWSDGPKDWSAAEWAELRELQGQMLDHFDGMRRHQEGGATAADSRVELALPSTDHRMLAADQPGYLLSEAWRLQHHAGYAAWLADVIRRRDFATRARENVHLRRIAIEAARFVPGSATFDVLRRVYRDRRCRDRVVEADREYLAQHPGANTFASGLAELGLHAPMASSRFPVPRRRHRRTAVTAAPRITVVIPSYRHEAYVRLAIESCLRQTIADVRVLVVDDRSPDGTVAAARAIDDPRLRVEVNEANLGLGASVLGALELVDTPFVALLNSDDLFHSERLERCLAAFEAEPEVALVATGFAVVDRAGMVLTHETSCAAEIGPKAHGWIRWFGAIARDELRRPEDWVSFEVLLRHNVLATSSNMVFRTDWLRRHMPEASRLKYCLDWQLFLQAAMEGSLQMVEGQLLAYRLHDANTVWFAEGGRADYVYEVNRVVDRVLGQWFERAVAAMGAAAAVERLARLLEDDVRAHGETDGLALYLSDLVGRHAAGGLDPEAVSLTALAEAALRRKTYARVTDGLDVDPWDLPWRLQAGDRWRIERDVADGLGARARSLDNECARLRLDLDSIKAETEDLRSMRQRTEPEIQDLRGQVLAMRAAHRELEAKAKAAAADQVRSAQQVASLRLEAERQAESIARLRSLAEERLGLLSERRRELAECERRLDEHRRLVAERDQRLDKRRQLLAERDRRLDEHRQLLAERDQRLEDRRREIAQLVGSLEQGRSEMAAISGELEAARQSVASLGLELQARMAEIASLLGEREEARSQARLEGRLRHRAIVAALAAHADLRARLRSPSWRLGDTLMRRIGVLGAYKTLAGWMRRLAAAGRRGGWHLQRFATAAGRERSGVIVFADADAGGMLDERVLRWLRPVGREPRRLVGWTDGLLRQTARDIGRGLWLADDARLAASDRDYFRRRNATGVEALELLFETNPWLRRAWRGARIAKTTRSRVAIAQGLAGGAVQAYAAKLLCGVRCVLVLGDEDLSDPGFAAAATAAILRAADVIVADSDLVLRAVERLAGSLPERAVIRWAVPAAEGAVVQAAEARHSPLRCFVHWCAAMRVDPETLVEGVRLAAAGGLELRVDVVGRPGSDAEALHRRLMFEDRLQEAGVAARFRLHGEVAPAARRRLLRDSDVVLWIGRSMAAAGLPFAIVEAMAAARPVIASAVPELTWVPALAEQTFLVEPGDAGALATALQALAADPAAGTGRAEAALALLAANARDDPGLV